MRVTAETKSATRQRILDAAERMFAEKGFETATTRDIAREAGIAVGTLFNYFPSKESLALCLVSEAYALAVRDLEARSASGDGEPLSLEEDLFGHVAAVLRKLKPFRPFLAAVLETALSPLSSEQAEGAPEFRTVHLEIVREIAARHGLKESLPPLALQLYWTLYIGVLAFWRRDSSPRQEDTLALLDHSIAMFVGWLTSQANPP